MIRSIMKHAPILGASIALFACSDVDRELFEANRPKSHGDAGSIHLAVAPPIPFEPIRDALMPTFNLTGDKALEKALPNTGYLEDRFFQMISVAGGLGLPKSSVTGAKSDGTAPQPKAPDGKLDESGKSPLKTGDDKRPLQHDPILQYTAATALYQEVKLLERYVAYAAKRHGYVPFIVRMNIGVQPFARGQPYDVYSSIGFFTAECQNRTPTDVAPQPTITRQPYILPLLVTDNLEGISAARSAEMITQIALAVTVLAQGLAGEASFGFTRDRMKSVLGTDLNALLTVSRSADNVIQARLGAASQPTSRFAMVPRNHTITVLMLVPREQFAVSCFGGPPAVRTVMRSVLRDAAKGEVLPFDREALFKAMYKALIDARVEPDKAQWLTATADGNRVLARLISIVQSQRRVEFDSSLREHGIYGAYRDALWVAMAEFDTRTPFQSALVTLCNPEVPPRRDGKDFGCVPVTTPRR